MSDDLDDMPGCLGCTLMIVLSLVCVGFIGLAWKFCAWCWS